MEVLVSDFAGTFAENKDVARHLRKTFIEPTLAARETVVLDFSDVTGATQSFIHALISQPIRDYGDGLFDSLFFKNCSPLVKEVIEIVAEYMQESF